MNLQYHLENRHRVVFGDDLSAAQLAAAVETQTSPFIDWMAYINQHEDGRDLLYSDIPLFYTYNTGRGWHPRIKGQTIGRMPVEHPSQLKHFHLRQLLAVKRGARSYQDLYTLNGIEYSRPSEVCVALGLI